MKKVLGDWWKGLQKEARRHRLVYFILTLTLLGGWFIRTHRTDQILGFYFDQGRDAKVIWDLWHSADLFLIGPTTGIAGIFRGPLYYYLIAPFYLISDGNPLGPSYFLAFTSMIAVLLLYCLGKRIQGRATGLFAAMIGSFSFYIMVASRWLSNPTPMLLLSLILVWMLILINDAAVKKKGTRGYKWGQMAWVVLAFVSGMSLFHFGSAGEFFYFPAIGVFFIWQVWKRMKLKKIGVVQGVKEVWEIKTVLLSLLALLFTASPLILFDFLHDRILSGNIRKFFVEDESFKVSFWQVAKERLPFYYDVFASKIFHWIRIREKVLLAIIAVGFIARLKVLLKNDGVKILLILLLAPIVGLLFFQGNFGNIYDYYLTGYYLIFILLFAIVLGQFWKYKLGKVFVFVFFAIFLTWNGMVIRYHIIAGVDGPETVLLGNQMQAVEWVYNDARDKDFNTDVYVPPVIPHAYDYLFTWYPTTFSEEMRESKGQLVEEHVDLLYTLYEVDPPHPERLEEWLVRQRGIGNVEETRRFGGITVERRRRL